MEHYRVLRRNFIIIALLGATFLIFLPPYDFAFVGDDYVQFDYIAELAETPAAALNLFNPYYLTWYYRPVQNLWFLIGRLVFGYVPFPYYFAQGLMHLLAVALVWRVGRQVGLRPFPTFIAAALFAIHGHWVDVVGWNSSIAIVLAGVWTLAAISAWLAYLQRPSPLPLLLTALFYLLCLTTHEETFLLPLVLLALWLWQRKRFNLQSIIIEIKQNYGSVAFLAGTAVLTAAFLWVQLNRPNITIDLTGNRAADFAAAIAPLPLSRFLVDSLIRVTLLTDWRDLLLANSYLISYLILLLLALWLWKGGPIARIAILWTVSHLAFIYLTLYSSKPELYAGRHIYNSWIAISLALGEVVQRLMMNDGRLKPNRQLSLFNRQFSLAKLVTLLIALAIVAAHINVTRQVQATWLAKANEDMTAKAQMQEILPTATAETSIFATRFPITPNFMRSVVQVWYDLPRLDGLYGPISRLRDRGFATATTYVFDYDGQQVVNLTPEFQEAAESFLVWADAGRVETVTDADTVLGSSDAPRLPQVAGPDGDRRLALGLDVAAPEQWQSWVTTAVVPTNATLRFAARATSTDAPAGAQAAVRLRLTDSSGSTQTIWQDTVPIAPAESSPWLPVGVDMAAWGGQPVTLRLEVRVETAVSAAIFWANPRFVR